MKILSQNIWNLNCNWPRRLDIFSTLLDEQKFHEDESIIVLHESESTREHDQINEVNSSLAHPFPYLIKVPIKEEKDRNYYIGILSNINISLEEVINLSISNEKTADKFPRIFGLSMCSPQCSNQKFYLGVTHFALDEHTQISNAEQTGKNIEKVTGEKDRIIICADLNSSPTDIPLGILKKYGLNDVWTSLNKKEFNSWPVSKDLVKNNNIAKYGTEPEWEIIPRRIDYILEKNFPAKSIKKFGRLVNDNWFSDHFGIFAEF
jgi:endonuclease/exonuclease/phosphatase family metal-dependent hydrolase